HFLTQIPQPIHRNSEMKAILSVDLTSMQSFPGGYYTWGPRCTSVCCSPILTTGHD
ncbi:hypothetical protein DFH07DRAFT_728532, partial [Mycena maculata]